MESVRVDDDEKSATLRQFTHSPDTADGTGALRTANRTLYLHMLRCLILLLLLTCSCVTRAQVTLFGLVRDSVTHEVIPFANILVKGTVKGTSTDEQGSFRISADSVPVTLVVTCIGYRTTEFMVTKAHTANTILLAPVTRLLNEVVISSDAMKCLQKDRSLMAADFEFYDNYLLLLAHKDFRSPSRLMLLDENGNNISTLYVSSSMESLYRDCFGNVHVLSADSAWQVHYDYEKLQLVYPVSSVQLKQSVYPCVAMKGQSVFMQFTSFHGLRAEYFVGRGGFHQRFYYASDTAGVQFITSNYDLNYFLQKRRMGEGYQYPVRFIRKHLVQLQSEVILDPTQRMLISPINAPLLMHDNAAWIFQFPDSIALRFNDALQIVDSVKLDFHRHNNWTGDMFRDEITDQLYTTYLKEGILRICALNDVTFQIENEIVLDNVPYPASLQIRNGVAYFLFLNRKENSANRMLYRYWL